MLISEYCKNKNMTLEEYNNFKSNIKAIAQAIKQPLKYQGGVYYPVDEILPQKYNSDENIRYFIIQELKHLGIEFFDNNNLYRFTE